MRDDATPGTPPTPPRRRPRTRRRRAALAAVWACVGLLGLGGAGIGYVYFQLDGNLEGIDINAALGRDRPSDGAGGSMDILVMGSDSRAGENAGYGRNDGAARADTAMVVHVDEDRDRASIVSIPRDTEITRPACRTPEGRTAPVERGAMFNSAYAVGGPACAVKTVETISGVRMDHFLEVDFTGFKEMVDRLGGVDITLKEPLRDRRSRLDLPAGPQTLNGEQALGLVRARYAVGDGSDLGRIKVQQAFVKALVRQVGEVGLFTDPGRLYGLADTATSAVTADSELDSVEDLTGLARTLKGVEPEEIDMVTLPVRYDPDDRNRVEPLPGKAAQVWKALREDRPIPASATRGTATEETDTGDVVR